MKAVLTLVVAAVAYFAQGDDVAAIPGHNKTHERILQPQPGVSGIRQNPALGVQHGESRVPSGASQTHPFNLCREPLSFSDFDPKAIQVLAGDDTGDRRVERHWLRSEGIIVRFLFRDNRKRADQEGQQLRQAGSRAQAQVMFAKVAVRRDFHLCGDGLVGDEVELEDLNTRLVANDFLGVL